MPSPKYYLETPATYADGTAAPSMYMENGYTIPDPMPLSDSPEGPAIANARNQLHLNEMYAYEQTMGYGTLEPQDVTWDYASPFLYRKNVYTPYPYVLQG